MTGEDDGDGAPPPTENPQAELPHGSDHSEQQSKATEDTDDEEDSPPPSSPPLLDLIDFPPPSTLPPTPPLPCSSPRDMEQQDSDEDDGPPPGWDKQYGVKEQEAEHVVTLATASTVSSDLQTEDVRQDAHNKEGEPGSQAQPSIPPEVAPSDLDMEQQDSDEDDRPPPGWDNKYQVKELQAEQAVTLAAASTVSSDVQTEDVRQDAHGEEGEPGSQAQPSLPPEVAPSDVAEHDSEDDDGPPPGWDSKCQPVPELQKASQSDVKMEDVLQDAQNEEDQPTQPTSDVPSACENTDMLADREDSEDEGPPPGWDSKCQPETELQKTPQSDSSDIKTSYVQQDAHNENSPQSLSQSQTQSQSRSSPATEPVPSTEHDSDDDGPPPGWNSKCQLKPNSQTTCPATPPLDFKIEEDKEDALDKVGTPPARGSTPQQQSHVHSSLPSPIVQSETGYEPNNVKVIEESPQPPSRQQPIHPTKPQISVPKPPMFMNNPEMGQMVCGSCRHLLSYPRGARYVECACCLEENYVLEEHEVGQVVCAGCNVLLMYPHGAPKVRCANCRTETEIGDQNRRPPLSEHKRRAKQHLKRLHAG